MSYTVLMYHEIRKDNEKTGNNPIEVKNNYKDVLPTPLYCDYKDFKEQITYLVQEGYHFLRMNEVMAYHEGTQELPNKSVLVSFDDAYQSVLEYAYPILKEHNIKASLFLVSGWLQEDVIPFDDTKSRTLTLDQVYSMRDVFEFVNHTHTLHERDENMRSNLMDASVETIKKDLETCNQYVDITDAFAYPFGFYDETTPQKLKECGIDYAFTSDPGINTKETDPLYLHRFPVFYGCDLEQFKKMLV